MTSAPGGATLTIAAYAVRAPSSRGPQPSRFRVSEGSVDRFAHRTPALPVTDPEDRDPTMVEGLRFRWGTKGVS